jgi:hypothetical protein
MPSQRQFEFVFANAAAIVGDFQQLAAAARQLDADIMRTGIEAIFEQFFESSGRPLDHFACCNLVDEQLGQQLDGHGKL